MRKGYIAAIVACASVTFNASAQTNTHGTVSIGSGYGVTAPWQGDIRVNIPISSVVFSPYINVSGISEHFSEKLDDRTYIYSKSSNTYRSTQMLQSNGFDLKYGTTALIPLNTGKINVKLEGQNHREETTGTLDESLVGKDAIVHSDYYWVVNMPRLDQDIFNAGINYNYRDFIIGYNYHYKAANEDIDMDATLGKPGDGYTIHSGFGGNGFRIYQHNAGTKWHNHNANIQKSFFPANGQLLTVGLSYVNNSAGRNHLQKRDNLSIEKSTFNHTQETSSAFAEYRYNNRWIKASARLEYAYTNLKNDFSDKNLHDLIPQAALMWNLGNSDTITASYRMILKRPDIELLDPTHIYGSHSDDYGNAELEGIHINNISLAYNIHRQKYDFRATLAGIIAEDGFNAIWMEKNDIRISTWGNEGVRRAYSFTPLLRWHAAAKTSVNAQATIMWDKRIARAISMAKEHWGISAEAGVHQLLPRDMTLDIMGRYSEGNTIDLYSHESSSFSARASLKKSFLKRHALMLSYDCQQYAKAILTQGAYTGSIFNRPGPKHTIGFSAIFSL